MRTCPLVIRLWIKPFPEPSFLASGRASNRVYDAAECRSIRTAYRASCDIVMCPRHPGHALKVTWVQKTTMANGKEMPTFLQVVCERCGFAAGIDMMDEQA